jgi:hypothetical protein
MRGDIHLEREGDALILRSRSTARWVGALFAGIALVLLIGLLRQGPQPSIGYWFGILFIMTFLGFGLFLALPRRVTTRFDLRSRRVLHTVSIGRWDVRQRSYSFAEIASLGVKEFYSEGYSYLPVMTLHSGTTHWLAASNGGYMPYAKTIGEVCEATGLPKRDVSHRWWGG